MDIIKYKKVTKGMYEILFDNGDKIKIHEDLILKYDLLLTKSIKEDELNDLLDENIIYELYYYSVKYINTKLRSKKEIFDYLLKKTDDINKINRVIDILFNQGYLNDYTYIKSYVNDKINLSNDGPLKIKKYLLENNFKEEEIDNYLSIFDYDFESDRINKIISKAIRGNKKSLLALRLNLKNNLVNLGYHSDIINDCLNCIKIDEEEIKRVEYDKLYKKYSKKYNGQELEYKIKQALYQKGFK